MNTYKTSNHKFEKSGWGDQCNAAHVINKNEKQINNSQTITSLEKASTDED